MTMKPSCPGREQLRRFAVGKLDAETTWKVNDHLSACSSCAETVAWLFGEDTCNISRLPDGAPRRTGRVAQPRGSTDDGSADAVPPVLEAVTAPLPASGADGPSGEGASGQTADFVGDAGLTQVGQYRILGKIGRGGMGDVYRAVHTKLDKPVALKILPPRHLWGDTAARRFEREMKAIGRLDHPNVVRATDAGQWNDLHYLAMELVEGIDLARHVRDRGPLPVADACEIIRQTAESLQYAHEQGLVHRDIKPSNIMLTQAGQVKVLDFGLALLAQVEAGHLTSAERIMGTLDYMAPEQASDSHAVDHRADIYSLGCTFYELLCGRAPFANSISSSPVNKMMAHAQQPPPPIRAHRSDVPGEIVELIEQMLAKNIEDRPQTAAEVAQRLKQLTPGANLSALLPVSNPRSEPGSGVERGTTEGSNCPGSALRVTTAGSFRATRRGFGPRPAGKRTMLAVGAAVLLGGIISLAILVGLITAPREEPSATPKAPAVTTSGRDVREPNSVHALNDEDERGLQRYLAGAPANVNAIAVARHCREAFQAWRERSYSRALEETEKALELDPGCAVALHHRGMAYNELMEYEKALDACSRAIELEPLYSSAYVVRAWAYQNTGRYQEAIKDYTRALGLGQIHARTYVNRGVCYGSLRRFREAIADYNQAIALDDTYAWAYRGRAMALHDSGVYEQAIADYSEAIRLDPTDKFNYANRGVCYACLQRWSEAIGDYTRAIELDAADVWAYLNRSDAHARLGDADKARADYARALQLAPSLARRSPFAVAPSEAGQAKPYSYALSFDGVDDYVMLPKIPLEVTGPLTLEAWLVPTGDYTDQQAGPFAAGHIFGWENIEDLVIVAFADGLGAALNPALEGENPTLRFYSLQRKGLDIGRRQHVALTLEDGRHATLFVDGQRVDAQTLDRPIGNRRTTPTMGALVDAAGDIQRAFAGRIDEARLSRSLCYRDRFTPQDEFPADGETIALYRFDEGQGTVLQDASGNGYHGTIHGATWVRRDGRSDLSEMQSDSDGTED